MAVTNAEKMSVHGASLHNNVARKLWIPALSGFILVGAPTQYNYYGCVWGTADGDQPDVYFAIRVPDDFVSFTSVQALWVSTPAAGNMYWQLQAQYGAAGQICTIHVDLPALGATATGGVNILNLQAPANPLTLVNLAALDYLGIKFYRNGANALDTLNVAMYFLGLLFNYVGAVPVS